MECCPGPMTGSLLLSISHVLAPRKWADGSVSFMEPRRDSHLHHLLTSIFSLTNNNTSNASTYTQYSAHPPSR